MYSVHSEHPTPYLAPTESAITMQIVSFILDNATEARLSVKPFYICVEENLALERKLSSFIHDIDEGFGCPLFDQNFLVIEDIRNAPPAFIDRLQKELGIRTHVYRVAGKNMVVLPPEARDSLIAFAAINEHHQTESSPQVAATQTEDLSAADPFVFKELPRYATYFFNDQRQAIFEDIYKLQTSQEIPISEKYLEEKRIELENLFEKPSSTEHELIPEAELVLQLSQNSNSH